jgi:hypothetical protein
MGVLGDVWGGIKKVAGVTPLGMVAKAGYGILDRMANPPQVSTEDAKADRDRSTELYNQMMAERANTPVYVPPTVTNREVGVNDVHANNATAVNTGPVERVGTSAVAAPQDVTLGGRAQGVSARDVLAPQVGPAMQAGVVQTGAAQIADTQGQEIRAKQLGAVDLMQGAATGAAPSAAAAQQARGLQDLTATQTGLAAQAHGNQGVFARREAMRNIADMGSRQTLDSALLRATEMATARGQLTGALSDVRGTDTGTAVHQADLTQGTNLANMGEAGTTGRANAAASNDMSRFGTQIATDVAAGNANRGLTADTTSAAAQNARDVDVAGVQAGNVARGIGVATANADRTLTATTRNANAADANANQNADRSTNVGVGNANRDLAGQTTNQGAHIGAETTNAANNLTAQQTNVGSGLSANSQRIAESGNKTNAVLQANNQVMGGTAQAANIDAGNIATMQKSDAAVIGGGASAGAAALQGSDERIKKDISRTPDDQVDDFLKAMESHNYRYKDPAEGAGQRHGPMAQELEKSEMGRSVVKQGPDGVKRVDTDAFVLALAGAVARKMRQSKGGARAQS